MKPTFLITKNLMHIKKTANER